LLFAPNPNICAHGFKCGYIDTGNPDNDIDHDNSYTATMTKVAASYALGYLNISTRARTLHEHFSASSTVQATATLHP
jgi:hypothetical protein